RGAAKHPFFCVVFSSIRFFLIIHYPQQWKGHCEVLSFEWMSFEWMSLLRSRFFRFFILNLLLLKVRPATKGRQVWPTTQNS
ncbi:MAG: hypothetical protein AB2597_18120, partial [Candidatus Thiodiazotropha sp.]